jgi:DNA-binding XRE family transcriptional regulator
MYLFEQEVCEMSESVSIIPNIIIFAIIIAVLLALVIYLLVLVIRALRKYLKSGEVREEKKEYKKSLGEVLKAHRTSCHMTQEFVAESIGVTRQAVSKWENGTADPSTSNLLALAKLYGVSAEKLLSQVKSDNTAEE